MSMASALSAQAMVQCSRQMKKDISGRYLYANTVTETAVDRLKFLEYWTSNRVTPDDQLRKVDHGETELRHSISTAPFGIDVADG